MKFYGKITVARYTEDNWNPEITEILCRSLRGTKRPVRKSASHKDSKRTGTLLVDTALGQRNPRIHGERSPLETLEFTTCYLQARQRCQGRLFHPYVRQRIRGNRLPRRLGQIREIRSVSSGHRPALEIKRKIVPARLNTCTCAHLQNIKHYNLYRKLFVCN